MSSAIKYTAGMAATVWLVTIGYPVWAGIVLGITALLSVGRK